MLTLYCIFAASIITAVYGQNDGATCSGTAPSNPTFRRPKDYQFASAALHLFKDLEMPCDGMITSWQFISRQPTIELGAHLAIYRKYELDDSRYVYINETELKYVNLLMKNVDEDGNSYTFDAPLSGPISAAFPTWVTMKLARPLAVKRGDIVAIYYNNIKTNDDLMTIPHRDPAFVAPVYNTWVFLYDRRLLSVASTLDVDSLDAGKVVRNIALVANLGNIQVSTSPPPSTSTARAASSITRPSTMSPSTSTTTRTSSTTTRVIVTTSASGARNPTTTRSKVNPPSTTVETSSTTRIAATSSASGARDQSTTRISSTAAVRTSPTTSPIISFIFSRRTTPRTGTSPPSPSTPPTTTRRFTTTTRKIGEDYGS